MNLWHQRLIIFLAKLLAVILGCIFIGYFLYYNLYFKQDALIKYVPAEAVAYGAFRITPELNKIALLNKIKSQIFQANNLTEPNWDQLNQLTGNNFSLAIMPAHGSNAYDFDYLLLFDLGLRKNVDQQYLERFEKYGWPFYIFTNQTKSKKILAIASSEILINKVKQVAVKNEPALSQNVGLVLNLKKFSPNEYWGKFYVNNDYFFSLVKQTDRLNEKMFLASLSANNFGTHVFGIKNLDNKIIVTNDQTEIDLPKINDVLKNLPANIEYCLSFDNIGDNWQAVTNRLKYIDSDYYDRLMTNLIYIEGVYGFSMDSDILPVINQDAQIVKSKDDKFLLSAKIDNQSLPEFTSKIEMLIKSYLASNNPVEKKKQLPDYTYITQIVREPDTLNFIEDQIADLKIRLLDYDDQEYAYIMGANSILIANSREIISNSIENDQVLINWQNTGNIINFSNKFSQNLFLSNNILNKYNSNLEVIKYIILSGDNELNNFRLILE